ncbi:interleukin-12 receptor subunit beta-2 [Vombatus ursinus]|uniref:Fibronectin type-III domain-containing protein n=1 Tax=Vombatus ursinus TaxID=29139 RepID=A0A4X2L101_VOMUR|nr:interleukin-12 receptor subunit beta-2 [Vombatus ursinus]
MAYVAGVYSATLILFITWLLMKAEIEVCKKGVVTVSPSRTVLFGSTVNISCSLKPKEGCSRTSNFQKLTFYQNRLRVHSQKTHLLSIQVSNLHLGTTVFVCKVSCGGHVESQVCGADISVGVTPEQPQNLSCSQLGEQGNVVCTWDKGRDTHLYTVHTLQLTGPNNLDLEKQCAPYHDDLDLGMSLSPASPEANYTAKVVASNSLGNSSSLPLVFSFVDIVKPLPPSDIRADFPNLLANFCTLQWQDRGPVVLNRLQFRPVHENAWKTVHVANSGGRYDLYNLIPFTEYEFQISSKLHSVKGRWSDWSKSLRTQTPREEPVGTLDVWYTVDDLEGGLQNVSLFWKNMSMSEARGIILGYQVTIQEVPGDSLAVPHTLENLTSHTHFAVVLPQNDYVVAVSAVNSEGSSSPSRTFIPRQPRKAPQNILAKPQGTDGIGVTWEPPHEAAMLVKEYLVEWRALGTGSSPSSPVNWRRLPTVNMSAVISEHVKPHVCYQIRLCALWGDGAGCARTWADLTSKEPLTGPRVQNATAGKGTATVTWDEIPAQDQMGCLLHYKIYLKELRSQSPSHIFEIPYEVGNTTRLIRGLRPGVTYVLWMTASTAAGEGPRGNERELSLEDTPEWNILVVPIAVALVAVGIFSMPRVRAKVKSVFWALQPQWYNQEIPDPANSMWAKKYSIIEDEMQLHFQSLSNNCTNSEEPETLEINEVLPKSAPTLQETHPSCWPRDHNLHEPGRESWLQVPKPFEVGAEYGVSHPSTPASHRPEKGQVTDPYRAMGSGGPKAEDPGSHLRAIPVDYLPAHIDYLPSNLDYLPSTAAGPPEDSELQGLSFSIFPKGSFHPLICGEKLTLDRVKIDPGPITH